MQKNIWQKLKKPARNASHSDAGGPIFVLAPMANVTDSAFRQMFVKYGKPTLFFTEFISADGLAHPKGKKKLLIDLKFQKSEKPIIAQFFGSNPENILKAAKLARKMGFDGVDINMGCPDKNVEHQGGGAAIIKNPKVAALIIKAAKKAGLPVSVKTRLGYNEISVKKWISFLLKQNLAALVIHLRTRQEMSSVLAHWEVMSEIVRLRDKLSPKTLILGNGDIKDLADAKEKIAKYKIDGVMIGRGVFGNPWFFSDKSKDISLKIKLKALLEHAKLFDKFFRKHKNFLNMRKHFGAYLAGYENIKNLRIALMAVSNLKETEAVIKGFLKPRR